MNRISVVVIATIASSVFTVRAAAGQTVRTTSFAGVSAGLAYNDPEQQKPGVLPSAGFSFGKMNDRSGFQLECDISGLYTRDSLPSRFLYTPPTSGYLQHGHFYERAFTKKWRWVTPTALYARRIWSGRAVAATFLIGGGLVFRPSQGTDVTKEVMPDGTLQVVDTYRRTWHDSQAAGVVGVDVDVRITGHLTIVPSVRVAMFPSALVNEDTYTWASDFLVARPQVGMRWRF